MNIRLIIACTLLASVLLFQGCSNSQKENPADTVLKGNIKFANGGSVYLVGYSDSIHKILGIKSILDTAKIEKNGDYRFVLHPKTANEYEIKYNDSLLLTDIYLQPAGKLEVNFGDKYSDPVINTNDASGKYNDYRVKLNRKFYFEPNVKQMYYISANYLHVHQFDSFVQVRKKEEMAFFENYFKGQKLDPDFEKYARAEIIYQYGIDKMMFLWKKRIKNVDVLPDSSYYQDISTKSYLENADALASPAYVHFLNLYINNIYGEGLVKQAKSGSEIKPTEPPMVKFELAMQNLNIPYCDIVVCNIIAGDMNGTELKALEAAKNLNKQSLLNWFQNKYHFKIVP